MNNRDSLLSEIFEVTVKFWDVIILTVIFSYLFLFSSYNSEILINLILLFVTAFLLEVHYISRYGALPNILVIIFILKDNWINVPGILKVYTIIGAIFGVILLLMAIKNEKLPNFFYSIAYLFYGLKTVMPLYIAYLLIGNFNEYFVILFIILLITIWYIGVNRFKNENPIDKILDN